MEIKNKACMDCIHYDSPKKTCNLWKVPIGNEKSQTCGSFELNKEFQNLAKIKLQPYHKINYQYRNFEVVDTRHNLIIYTESENSFSFTKYIILEKKKYRTSLYKIHFWKAKPFGKEKNKFAFYIEHEYSYFRYSWPCNNIVVSFSEDDRSIDMGVILEIEKIKNSILNKEEIPFLHEGCIVVDFELGVEVEFLK